MTNSLSNSTQANILKKREISLNKDENMRKSEAKQIRWSKIDRRRMSTHQDSKLLKVSWKILLNRVIILNDMVKYN